MGNLIFSITTELEFMFKTVKPQRQWANKETLITLKPNLIILLHSVVLSGHRRDSAMLAQMSRFIKWSFEILFANQYVSQEADKHMSSAHSMRRVVCN